MTGRLSLLFALLVSQPLGAQAPGPLDGAAETITAHDLRAKIEILAHDSMMGRDTPSPGLERAAAYVVGEFRRLGLRPAGEVGTYVQRFGVSRWTVDTGSSSLELAAGEARAKAAFGSEVRVIGGEVSGKPISGGAVLVAGPLIPAVMASPRLRGRIVILAPDFERPMPFDLGERVDEIAAVARAVILLSNRDSSTFARRIDTSLEPRLTPDFRD